MPFRGDVSMPVYRPLKDEMQHPKSYLTITETGSICCPNMSLIFGLNSIKHSVEKEFPLVSIKCMTMNQKKES